MNVSHINNQHKPESIDSVSAEDLEIREDDDEVSTDESKDKNKDKKTRVQKKKRPKSSSTSIGLLYDQLDTKNLIRNIAASKQNSQLQALQDKIKNGFEQELNTYLKEAKQPKAAALFSDSVKRNSDKSLSEKIKDDQEEARTLKQKKLQTTKKTRQTTQAYLASRTDLHQPLKEFISVFGQSMMEKDGKSKRKLEALRSKLQSKGVSTRHLHHIEKGTQSIIAKDLKRLVKQNFINLAMTNQDQATPEVLDTFSKYYNILDITKGAGIFKGNTHSLNKVKEQAKDELNSFIAYELDSRTIEEKLKTTSIKPLMKAFDELNSVAKTSNFSPREYLKTFQKKLDHFGLVPFIAPHKPGTLDTDTPDQQQSKKRHRDTDDEHFQEEQENDLFKLYLKSHLSHKFFDKIKCRLSLLSLERQCKTLNINIQEIKKKARSIAILKAKMECRTCFETRATLVELKGPEHKRFLKSLKCILKVLKSLDHPLTKPDLKLLRDQSNRAIFTLIKEDYIKNEIFLEANPKNRRCLLQKKHYLKILNRLQSETAITEDISPKLLQDLHFLHDVVINEAA